MSPSVTFKSNEDKAPQSGALVDSAGKPVPPAAVLSEQVAAPFTPSHGRAPREMPPRPVGLVDLGPAAALRVTGPDREKWMQGMQSNDLAAAPFGGAVAGVFLGGKGRLVAEGLVWRRDGEVLVTTLPERLQPLHAHLDRLLIMEDCELAPAPGLRRLRFCPGPPPKGMVSSDIAGAAAEIAGSVQPLGFEMLLDESAAQALLARIPERADPAALEEWRIALGLPAWGSELDEETTALEAGLDRQLSFAKGCYVGQEVVAMATYRGRVSWNLVRLEVEGEAPVPGTRVDPARATSSERRGRVTSSTRAGTTAVFLAYVHKELIVPGSTVLLEDGRSATVLGLPFASQPGAGVCA